MVYPLYGIFVDLSLEADITMKYRINNTYGHSALRPEAIGEIHEAVPTIWQLIVHRIAYLHASYTPVAIIFISWIAFVYFGVEYVNNH